MTKLKAGILTLCIVSWATLASAKQPRVVGDQLSFELPDLQGESISSSADLFHHKVLLVTLWGPWCPPCLTEVPTLNRLQVRYAADGLAVVAIAFDRGSADEAWKQRLRRFAKEHGIVYLILDGGAIDSFSKTLPMVDDVQGFPVEILIDRNGQVVDCRNGYGYNRNWERKLEGRIKKLLSAKP